MISWSGKHRHSMNGTSRVISVSTSTRSPRAGFDTADVDDVVATGPVDRVSGSRVAESRTLVDKRIRGAVDDRHDQPARSPACDWTTAALEWPANAGGENGRLTPAVLTTG